MQDSPELVLEGFDEPTAWEVEQSKKDSSSTHGFDYLMEGSRRFVSGIRLDSLRT